MNIDSFNGSEPILLVYKLKTYTSIQRNVLISHHNEKRACIFVELERAVSQFFYFYKNF